MQCLKEPHILFRGVRDNPIYYNKSITFCKHFQEQHFVIAASLGLLLKLILGHEIFNLNTADYTMAILYLIVRNK